MKNVLGLKCLICDKLHRPATVDYVCPDHGDEGILDVHYDYDFIGRQISKEVLSQSQATFRSGDTNRCCRLILR